MNKDTITIDGQTYVKQGSENSSSPSSSKIWAARIVKRLLFLFFVFVAFVISAKVLGTDRIGAAGELAWFIPSLIVSWLLSRFIAIKIFGKSVINAISFFSGDSGSINSSSMSYKPMFHYGSSADPDIGNHNYHGR